MSGPSTRCRCRSRSGRSGLWCRRGRARRQRHRRVSRCQLGTLRAARCSPCTRRSYTGRTRSVGLACTARTPLRQPRKPRAGCRAGTLETSRDTRTCTAAPSGPRRLDQRQGYRCMSLRGTASTRCTRRRPHRLHRRSSGWYPAGTRQRRHSSRCRCSGRTSADSPARESASPRGRATDASGSHSTPPSPEGPAILVPRSVLGLSSPDAFWSIAGPRGRARARGLSV